MAADRGLDVGCRDASSDDHGKVPVDRGMARQRRRPRHARLAPGQPGDRELGDENA